MTASAGASVPAQDSDKFAQRLVSVDFLRGIAILWVLAVHMPNDAPGGWRENPWFFASFVMKLGSYGVPLFILLSGFCIHRKAALQMQLGDKFHVRWGQFWKRRFWRLYPPYLAAIAFGLLVPTLFGVPVTTQAAGSGQPSYLSYDVLTHLSMTHNLTEQYATGLRNGVYWSLGLEEQLYGLYFLLLVVLVRWGWAPAIGISLAIAVAWRFAITDFAPYPIVEGVSFGSYQMWPTSYWLHWILGALAVSASVGNLRIPKWCGSILSSFVLLSLAVVLDDKTALVISAVNGGTLEQFADLSSRFQPLGGVFLAFAFFSLMLWVVNHDQHWIMRNFVAAGVAAIGRVSYSVYLTHIPCMTVLTHYTVFSPTGVSWLLRMLVYLSTSLAVGTGFYFLVERRFLHRKPETQKAPVESRLEDSRTGVEVSA